MSMKNKPYLPLYVQDFMTDEKLAECSAESTGVYIRLMCLFHKSEPYGMILLKQKDKQTDKQIQNFCLKLVKHLPYSFEVIHRSITELVDEGVLQIDDDRLFQKRMIKDADTSEKRSIAGSSGGKKSLGKNNFAQAKYKANSTEFAQAKTQANSDIDIENDIDIDIEDKRTNSKKSKSDFVKLVHDFTTSEDLQKTIFDFIEHRKISAKPALTFRALGLFLQRLQELSKNEFEQIALIEQAILSGWKTVYPKTAPNKKQADDDFLGKVARGEIVLD